MNTLENNFNNIKEKEQYKDILNIIKHNKDKITYYEYYGKDYIEVLNIKIEIRRHKNYNFSDYNGYIYIDNHLVLENNNLVTHEIIRDIYSTTISLIRAKYLKYRMDLKNGASFRNFSLETLNYRINEFSLRNHSPVLRDILDIQSFINTTEESIKINQWYLERKIKSYAYNLLENNSINDQLIHVIENNIKNCHLLIANTIHYLNFIRDIEFKSDNFLEKISSSKK